MKLENLERVNEIASKIAKREEFLKTAKDKDFELKELTFLYERASTIVRNKVLVQGILKTIHDMYVLELERELVELKAELETL
jgi:hypothetical protein